MKAIFTVFLFFFFLGIQAQSLVINEFSSLNTTYPDEDRDTPDWFELYNTTETDLDLQGWYVSDDSTNLQKWQFPSVVLQSKKPLCVFASGKDRKSLVYYDNIIQQGDTFYYSIGNASIPSNWKTADFDASGWDQGTSGFGYGDNDDATVVPDGTLSVFVRKCFTLDHPESIIEALLHLDYDDGFVAYLNGVEIARANLGTPNTDVPYNQTADTYIEPLMIYGNPPAKFEIANFADCLVQGTNILAIQLHNNSTTSSDLTLIPFLSFGYVEPVDPTQEMPEILGLSQKNLHTNFKIGSDGEQLYLSSPEGVLVDKTDSVPLPPGVSMGCYPDGQPDWFYFGTPTPGELNSTPHYDTLTESTVTFSKPGGVYANGFTLMLSATNADAIYYTTDGSVPTENSQKYAQPIGINSSTVVRAMAQNSQQLSIYPSIQTYVIETRSINLPVLSLTTDPFNLWDWNYGIYVKGPNAQADYPYFNANFWMDWERPVFLELMDKTGTKVFETSAGTKIFGAYSRGVEQKSMALFARKAYGNSAFRYPLFSERSNQEYKSFIIRNSGNDWNYTAYRDAMMTGLLDQVDIERQAYQPAVIYINGEYWGILNMREKINEDYLENHHSYVDADKVDILEGNGSVVEGSADHYSHMMSFINSNNLSNDVAYDSVCKMMDVINFMEYQIAQIYFDNTDWPGNNIKYWRPQTPSGKWRWLIYDTDFGFGLYNVENYKNNTLDFALETNGPDWPNPPWSTFLLRSLLNNPGFKTEFINRFADRMNRDFEATHVKHLIDSLKSNIADEIPYHNNRWNNMWGFDSNVENMKIYATNRGNYMRNYISSRFSLGGIVSLTVDVSDSEMGSIQVSSLKIENEFPWTGRYFKYNPVLVTALANPGYEFSHWEGVDANEASVLLPMDIYATSVKAVFKTSTKEYNSIVINEINYQSANTKNCGDWVELFNTTSGSIDLSNWVFKDADDAHGFVIPTGTVIPSKAYLVLYEDENKFKTQYAGIENADGPFGFGLNSIDETLRLYNETGLLIDSVNYQGEAPWPLLDEESGNTLSLITPYKDNEPYYRWEPSLAYGSPGEQNDNYNSIHSTPVQAFVASAFPNPFSQSFTVRWKLNESMHVKIQLFDYKGMLVHNLENRSYPAGTFEYVYDVEQNLPKGLYFLKIESDAGNSQVIKLIRQ